MKDSTKLEVEGGELLIKSSKGIMAVIPKDRVGYVKDLIERKNFAAVDKYVQGLSVLKKQGDKAQDGGIIQDPPVKGIAPAESTGNIAGSLARVNFRIAQRNAEKERLYQEAIKDKTGAAEEAFVARFNTSPHRYKYDTDPEYRKQVEKNAEETSKRFGSIDLPATDVRSRNYAGNPNLAFMTQKGMSKEGRRALEESNLEIIGAALPVPGVETVGKLPSLVKLGGKIASRKKVGATSWNGPLLDDLFKDVGLPVKTPSKINQFEADTPAGMTLEAFKTRIQSPEGLRRLKELGITEKDFLQEIQLLKNRKSHGDYSSSTNEINLDPFSPLPKSITRHEIEHAVQSAVAKSAKKEIPNLKASDYGKYEYHRTVSRATGISDIDSSLKGLELKDVNDLPEGFSKMIRVSDLTQPSSAIKPIINTDVLIGLGDDREALSYFKTGSAGGERAPFLAEVQEHMVNTGIIKDPYQKITIDDVKAAYNLDEGKYSERKLMRLFNIIQPTERNFKLIADNLNKMLSLTVAAAGAGAAAQKTTEQNEK